MPETVLLQGTIPFQSRGCQALQLTTVNPPKELPEVLRKMLETGAVGLNSSSC